MTLRTFLGGLLAVALLSNMPARAEVLVLGSVNDNIRKHVDRFTPLAGHLAQALTEDGITEVRITVLEDAKTMAHALRDGEVDLYFDSPLVAGLVAQWSGAQPFLRRWKHGVARYHSVIIVPTDSPILNISDLKGRRIGFQDPDSTSGFLLPAGLLLDRGVPVTELEHRELPPPPDAAGYVFTGDDKNTVLWLTRGWIDAGATDPRGLDILRETQPGAFRVLATSIDVPRQVVLHRADMDPDLVARLSALLTGLEHSETGREVMHRFHKTTRFDTFPDGAETTFAPIHALLDRLTAHGLIEAGS